jgi:hypothetical protein
LPVKTEENQAYDYPLYNYRMQVPQQKNTYDCGIFLIEFVARFLKAPQSLIKNPESKVILWDRSSDYELEAESSRGKHSSLLADEMARDLS